ncbi:hypothetical protein ACWCQN_35905 [Streptomyces sp. NPDC001984]
MKVPIGSASEREQTLSAAAELSAKPNTPTAGEGLAAFVACYVGLQRDPQPHQTPPLKRGPADLSRLEDALTTARHLTRLPFVRDWEDRN